MDYCKRNMFCCGNCISKINQFDTMQMHLTMQYANLQLYLALDVQKETYQAQYNAKNLVVVNVTTIHAYKTTSSQNCLLSFRFLESDMASIDSTRCVYSICFDTMNI